MKVLIINGSPRINGNTRTALDEMIKIFEKNEIESELINIAGNDIRGCISCNFCKKNGKCVYEDLVNELAVKLEEADGLVIGSPVYYASANGSLISLLDRLFHSTSFDKTMKVGAAVVAARRGGLSSTFDQLNKYFTISGMPVASSQYWNDVHGRDLNEAKLDLEGMQTMRVLAENMSFLIKCINLGKKTFSLPQKEQHIATNFIR